MSVKKWGLLTLALLCLTGAALAAEFQERTVLEGKVTLLTPKEFGLMPEGMLKLKYPSKRRPTVVLSNEAGTVNLAFNRTANRISNDIDALYKSMSRLFHGMGKAEWLKDEIVEVNGRQFVVFELITPAIDARIHNIIYMTPLDGTLLLISFNATEEEAPDWLEKGRTMLNSIRIHE